MSIELSHRGIIKHGPYKDLRLGQHPPALLLTLYRQMLRLRRIEEVMLAEYHPKDEMRCPIHFCIGQESIPAALSQLVQAEDYMFSHHRSHGYYFAKNAPFEEMFAEVYGKDNGANGGKAGSQDVSHSASKFYSGAILAGAITIAVGAAYGLKLKGSKNIAISGFGEGATDEGAFWEAMSHAGCQKLPALFVCENNRYATYSDQVKRQGLDNIADRVATFGVRSIKIFGNDVVLAYETFKSEIEKIRAGGGPVFVEAYTYRQNSHVGPEDDNYNGYRTDAEMEAWRQNCPLHLLDEKLVEAKILTPALKATMEKEIAAEIASHFKFAQEGPWPGAPQWHQWNWKDASPAADKLLELSSSENFDHGQADAKLGPY